MCPEHGAFGRGVNAAANIAARAVPRVVKARVTRAEKPKNTAAGDTQDAAR